MYALNKILPPKLLEITEKVGIATPYQILLLSEWDIKKRTNLSNDDIHLLKTLVSEHSCPSSISCDMLVEDSKVSLGCSALDFILGGGLRRGSITELYGESGSGKTQLGIQAAIYNWPKCCAYVCTEDLFPIKRFEEIKKGIPNFNSNTDYGSSTFVEHLTESKDLLSCIRIHLPKMLNQNKFCLLVIDSIAAPFRVESTNYIQRAEDMRELAISLMQLAQQYKLAVLCINQVTSALDNTEDMLPALGLAWSNMVTIRIHLKKTPKSVQIKNFDYEYSSSVRKLTIVFAPDLPTRSAEFIITPTGVKKI